MAVFNPADILLPSGVDMKKWSVVACDQYTSQKEYWDRVKEYTKDSPSTFNLIFPEAYLKDNDIASVAAYIAENMQDYIDKGIFNEYKNSLIYVKRTFKNGSVRNGLVGCVDLEYYDYSPCSKSKIRATEATVEDRLPPRVALRQNASLELPHILMLINDEKDVVLGKFKTTPLEQKLYDFELMEDGGHIEGYLISETESVISSIESLGTNPLIAVGDGNHSLAAAKKNWNKIKESLACDATTSHPARYALCEIVNLYEDSLVFEPIYRVVFNTDTEKLLSAISKTTGKYEYNINYYTQHQKGVARLYSDCHVEAGALTEFLEDFINENTGVIDYIHGEDTAINMGRNEGNIAFLNSCLEKRELFSTVDTFGPLPKKTFSMGNAEEKRFYTEARKLVL